VTDSTLKPIVGIVVTTSPICERALLVRCIDRANFPVAQLGGVLVAHLESVEQSGLSGVILDD
jgi:hypothetical protein